MNIIDTLITSLPDEDIPVRLAPNTASKPPIGLINLGLLIVAILLFRLGWNEQKHMSNPK